MPLPCTLSYPQYTDSLGSSTSTPIWVTTTLTSSDTENPLDPAQTPVMVWFSAWQSSVIGASTCGVSPANVDQPSPTPQSVLPSSLQTPTSVTSSASSSPNTFTRQSTSAVTSPPRISAVSVLGVPKTPSRAGLVGPSASASESRPSAQFTIGESGASATLSAGLHLKASSRAGTTLVAGSVIGGMLALCLVFLCWIVWVRRSLRRRRGTAPSFEFVPMEQSRHIARASFAYPVVEVTEVVTQDLKSEVLPPQPSSGRCTTNHGTLDNLRGRGNRGYHLPLVEEDSREDPSYCNSSESSSRLAAESTAHSHVDSEHIGDAI